MTIESSVLRAPGEIPIGKIVIICVSAGIAVFAFRESLTELVGRWSRQEEYSHGFIIPLISLYLLFRRRDSIKKSIGQGSAAGLAFLALAAAMLFVGELSALFIVSQLGFIVSVTGIVLAAGGVSLLRVVWFPIVLLLFCIPLPYFIDSIMSWRLQLLSSSLGVEIIRLFDVPVYLEGNIIDLGEYKLQVVEACSGLRYLYPLLSLSFLSAYLFAAPLWKRLVVFLSAVPITIFMNSLRIGLIGVLVDRWGAGMADDALHAFEGWVIFMASGALLALEIFILASVWPRQRFTDSFGIPTTVPPIATPGAGSSVLAISALVGLLGISLGTLYIEGRIEEHPERQSFDTFPLEIDGYQGRWENVDFAVEQALGFDDHILATFGRPSAMKAPIVLYVAYYASQRSGTSPHSPRVCIPGGGWLITEFERLEYTGAKLGLDLIPYNRVKIEKGSSKQVVYYWFEQRGRHIANEWVSKWYLFVDALIRNRTDGALVRFSTPIADGETDSDADRRLVSFMNASLPKLNEYLPE